MDDPRDNNPPRNISPFDEGLSLKTTDLASMRLDFLIPKYRSPPKNRYNIHIVN
jgi:hypothetical protein